jgi:hypothetical protein
VFFKSFGGAVFFYEFKSRVEILEGYLENSVLRVFFSRRSTGRADEK